MKYIFLAIAFFSLGYVIPTFNPFLQLLVAGLILLLLVIVLYFYIDTMAYNRLSDRI